MLETLLILACGLFAGLILSVLGFVFLRKSHLKNIDITLRTNEEKQRSLLEEFSHHLKSNLQENSLKAFSTTTDSMLKLAGHQLSGDREIIAQELKHNKEHLGQHLDTIFQQLGKVSELMTTLEKEKSVQFAQLSAMLTQTHTQTADLIAATSNLNAVLSNSQARGQWGERIADDILRLSGLVENVNYTKQKALANGSRPDFTFLLPKGLVLNMDVKFPIQNYTRFTQAVDKNDKEKFVKLFLSDVRACYKEVLDRKYIDPESSVDCVLVFIPHEQVFSFLQHKDPELFDQALRHKIISCSPMTLFAVLAVIHKAIDHFTLEKTSNEILAQISAFRKQWEMFVKGFQSLGKKISDVQDEFETLTNTRSRLLEKQLEKIDRLQQDANYH